MLRQFETTSLESAQLLTRTRRAEIVVTFDDGYADNLWNAKPLLNMLIPATMFVLSGYLVNRRSYWWDELDHLLLRPNTLPRHSPSPSTDRVGDGFWAT